MYTIYLDNMYLYNDFLHYDIQYTIKNSSELVFSLVVRSADVVAGVYIMLLFL
jgi:hypothetical protein